MAAVFVVFEVKKMEFGVFFFFTAPDVLHDLCFWVNFNFISAISRSWHPSQTTALGLNPSCVNLPASYWSFTLHGVELVPAAEAAAVDPLATD